MWSKTVRAIALGATVGLIAGLAFLILGSILLLPIFFFHGPFVFWPFAACCSPLGGAAAGGFAACGQKWGMPVPWLLVGGLAGSIAGIVLTTTGLYLAMQYMVGSGLEFGDQSAFVLGLYGACVGLLFGATGGWPVWLLYRVPVPGN